MLVEVVPPEEEVRHVFKQSRVVSGGIRSTRRLKRNHRADPFWRMQGGSHAEIAALAVRKDYDAFVEALQQSVISALCRDIVAAPARNTLAEEGLKPSCRKSQARMSVSPSRIGIPRTDRAERKTSSHISFAVRK